LSRESELAAFLASPHVRGIEYIAREDVRTALERFLAACAELEKAPHELCASDLRAVLVERLPARYRAAEPLARRTIDVLRVYLAFLGERLEPDRARELCVALEEDAETFRGLVRGDGAGLR
jgi:hypothetical protein